MENYPGIVHLVIIFTIGLEVRTNSIFLYKFLDNFPFIQLRTNLRYNIQLYS